MRDAGEPYEHPGTGERQPGAPSPRQGWTLTIEMTAYDSGMISVADRPINQTPAHDPAHGWLGAAETMILMLSEFRRQVSAR